ncbi:hypothetical protein A3J13_00015 [Candidatus Daviesbacteria bacterium RIFCSPLOWO2_02_FULL_36_8]|uniref:Uncharacterized protein n=1 Tax=Candidatus Daviesbacteria bacterium RIFCSPLOWO2_02_FULL_36_8 TaxID=1797793 RepID=A0A1F5MFJ7_9BACT|nr:MAG: hypothetical protein A3J13_00015 [Candidatus Daviesbacteria bacterium RIFCSPLOWO2_02_FULL_36_8]
MAQQERFTAIRIFRGPMEGLEQRYFAGKGATFKDLVIAIASDTERAARFMFDPTFPHFTPDWRKGGPAVVTPAVVSRMYRNFLESRGGHNV